MLVCHDPCGSPGHGPSTLLSSLGYVLGPCGTGSVHLEGLTIGLLATAATLEEDLAQGGESTGPGRWRHRKKKS